MIIKTHKKDTLSQKEDAHEKYALCGAGCPQKIIAFCVKQMDDKIISQGTIKANRNALEVKVAHLQMLEAITVAKIKSELCDAEKIADL